MYEEDDRRMQISDRVGPRPICSWPFEILISDASIKNKRDKKNETADKFVKDSLYRFFISREKINFA